MRRRIISMAMAILMIGLFASTSATAAERIVSLLPSVTEILFSLGAGGEVVAVSQYCDYPPAVSGLPRIGSFLTPNVEAIVALRPTLIIGHVSSSNLRETRALTAMGIPILMVRDDTVAQIEDSVVKIGERTGRAKEAREMLMQIKCHFDDLGARLDTLRSSKV